MLGTLPHSPEDGSLDGYCEGYREKVSTVPGKQVAKLGWIVTSEAQLGRFQVVTFASGFTPGTSALCYARNANIAIYEGAKLVALAYTSRSGDLHLGAVETLESGALLVWGDPPGSPIGELHDANGTLRLTGISPDRTFCRHRATVPNVYGKPFNVARKILIANGWRPIRSSEGSERWFAETELVKRGVIEVESCSGTGVGYCKFNYERPTGVLSVITVGGDPDPANDTVVRYEVECRTK